MPHIGFEPIRISTSDFESDGSANSPNEANYRQRKYFPASEFVWKTDTLPIELIPHFILRPWLDSNQRITGFADRAINRSGTRPVYLK